MTGALRDKFGRTVPSVRLLKLFALSVGWLCLAAHPGCDRGSDKAAAPIAHAAFDANVPDDFVLQAAPAGNVSIRIPPSWESLRLETPSMAVHAASPGQLGGLVNVSMFGNGGVELRPAAAAAARELERQIKPFKLLSRDYIRVAGQSAARLIYEGTVEGTDRRWMMIMFVRGHHTCLVTFAARPENFDAVRPTFDQILASIQIKWP